MKEMRTEEAIGQILCHDITRIIRGEVKDTVFRKGHVIREEDVPILLSVGKDHIYIWENNESMMHENEAADVLYKLCASDGMHGTEVKEGKINLIADRDGLFKIDSEKLNTVNSFGEMMIATRHGNTVVKAGDMLAGTRIIPLVIEKEKMEEVQRRCGEGSILSILPFVRKKAAVVSTGNEVFHGRIPDSFTPVIIDKLAEFGVEVIWHEIFDDDHEKITDGILRAIEAGAELVICTGGMSVDPDDRTPLAIKNTGAEIISYGSPVLPGAMFLLSYFDISLGTVTFDRFSQGENLSKVTVPNDMSSAKRVPVMGLPGCVMYSKRTVFDLVLPRVLADDPVTAEDLAAYGEGGLCLECPVCTYPNCGFGK